MIKKNVSEKTVSFLFVIATTLFLAGCSSSPIKYDVTSVASEDKVGILIDCDSFPSVYVGEGLSSSIYSTITGDKENLRKKIREVVKKGGESITQTLLQNWPSSLPPNPKIIQESGIVRDFWVGIDYLSTAKKNGLDILLYIEIKAKLTGWSQSVNNNFYWTPEISLSGSMIRSSDGKTLWRNSASRKSQIIRSSTYATGSDWDELENEFEKLTDTASGLVFSNILPGNNLELIQAAKDGDVRTVENLLSDSTNVDSKDKKGATALNWAATNGHTEVVKLLLENGADVDIRQTSGETALWVASWKGPTEAVRLLLENGADVNLSQTETGITPLWIASQEGYSQIVKLLLESGSDVNTVRTTDGLTALWMASWKGHTEAVRLLLENGADVNLSQTETGIIPLWIASQEGYSQIVKLLLESDSDVNTARTTDGVTALGMASNNGHTEVVKLLLNNGTDVNAKFTINNTESTALKLAKKKGHTEILQLLEKAGAKE